MGKKNILQGLVTKQENKQKLKINKKQINLVNIIKKTNDELDDYLDKQEQDNEFIIRFQKKRSERKTTYVEEDKLTVIKDYIHEKIINSNVDNKDILIFLLSKINNKGFLEESNIFLKNEILETLKKNLKIEEIETNIKELQKMLPLNIGCRTELEYKKKQIEKIENSYILNEIIDKLKKGFSKKKYLSLEKKYGEKNLEKYLSIFLKLKSSPFDGLASENIRDTSSVDFFIHVDNSGEIKYSLKKIEIKNLTEIKEKDLKEKYEGKYLGYIIEKYRFAKNLYENLKKRNEYSEKIIKIIIKKQKDYFLSGNKRFLMPMTYKDINTETGISISTISRIVSNKKIQTDFGIIKMKSLFSRHINNNINFSKFQIYEEIKNIVSENKNISDKDISSLLLKKGIRISRRTITNYRKRFNISNSYIREIIDGLKAKVLD